MLNGRAPRPSSPARSKRDGSVCRSITTTAASPAATWTAPPGTKLVVSEDEAKQLRQIFELYLKHEALIPTVQELQRRGWTNKRFTKRDGAPCGGMPFDKGTLFNTLTNVIYLGQVRYKDE